MKVTDLILKSFVIFLFASSGLLGAIIEVGTDKEFKTIQSAIDAAQTGDTILVQENVYDEIITIRKDALSLLAKQGQNPVIVGRIQLYSSKDITVDGFEIREWTGSFHGIDQANGSGLTVRNCKIHNGGETSWTAGINSRNSTRLTIENNEVFDVSKGLRLLSGHSSDSTFENGTIIRKNYIHDCPVDGIDIHGEYFTIDGNEIGNNIDANWQQHHPDGIQFIKSLVDGYSVASHVIIKNNLIYNHTQNIFIEGDNIRDVHIFNNVLFNERATINGADLASMATKNLISWGVEGLYVYNNYFGDSTNISVLLLGEGVFYFQNNILEHGVSGAAFDIEVPESLISGAFSHNVFHVSGGWMIVWAGQWFSSANEFESIFREFEGAVIEDDPLLLGESKAMPITGSPTIDSGVPLSSKYAVDIRGYPRPGGSGWDIGPYEIQITPPGPPNNLRLDVTPKGP